MKNLFILGVILALMNSFIGSNYIVNSIGTYTSQPHQKEAYINSILPIESFVLPVQGAQSIVHHLLKNTSSIPFTISPYASIAQSLLAGGFHYYINQGKSLSTLGFIKVIILRI
jgi:hypothetical protein